MFDSADIQKNKVMALLSYFIFFLPLIACPDSKFAKFHANQSLILVFVNIVASILDVTIIGMVIGIPLSIASTVFAIIGMIAAYNGQAKTIPWIGEKINIIK